MVGFDNQAAAGETLRRLYVYNGGFLTQGRVRRILQLAGYDIRLGKPDDGDLIGVWGQSPTSPRGEVVAAMTDTPILRVEDAFLRSVLPGRDGEPPIGLHLDLNGVHFDPAAPSGLEAILSNDPLDDTALLDRARDGIDRLRRANLSKYNAFDPATPAPDPGYVLIVDQTKDDASVRASRADANTFREMLYYAREEHPGARILIKSHPETQRGHRPGYYSSDDATDQVSLIDAAISPWALFEGAIAVYTVSSQLGFEAILAGHKPHVFGQPFYIGWGLTKDRTPLDRRQRKLTRAQLFAAAMILYPTWYDPHRDRLCSFEDAVSVLEAATREWRDDHRGWVATGMRLWKRAPLQEVFGRHRKVKFSNRADTARARATRDGRRMMIWANKTTDALVKAGAVCVEDGFLRSRGLGADLIPPLSLVLDDLGIYYDPRGESRLERLINASAELSACERARATRLIRRLTGAGVTKYNIPSTGLPTRLPAGRRILVPGQVEDDASILCGSGPVTTNASLLAACRAANPAAVLIYKPHPDVEAGLRSGNLPDAAQLADAVLSGTDINAALDAVNEVWTMTSATGFEALLRGKRVTCLGRPFYAGWGLTEDRGGAMPRRTATPDVIALAHAVLIAYPRYFDPLTHSACPVEVIVDRLANDDIPTPGRFNRLTAKLQGAFASYAHLWR